MREDFCVFILTHGRPDNVVTYNTLRRSGYTGRIYLVVDDEDKTAQQYIDRYGDEVLRFCKADIQAVMDDGDNFPHRRSVIYARNACWDLARQVGAEFFVQLDDDYQRFQYRYGPTHEYTTINIDNTFNELMDILICFQQTSGAATVAMAQGGDFIGGNQGLNRVRRKAMNSFICSVGRPFKFTGRMNDDVNTYVSLGHRGDMFFTVMAAMLVQEQTQASAGGLTELYLDYGTYVKSFYTVLYAPSCTQIGVMGDSKLRIHHKINWHNAVPVILNEKHRKGRP
jgi:hypothetical protein